MSEAQRPTETLEGWYALHAALRLDRRAWRALSADARTEALALARDTWQALSAPDGGGWSAAADLAGGADDVLVMHVRPSLDDVTCAQQRLMRTRFGDYLTCPWSFVSVTEVGLFHLSDQLAADAAARGGAVGDAPYLAQLELRRAAERDSPHVQRRLYPPPPVVHEYPYVSFYPMSKRRQPGQNWYALPIGERAALMRAHGLTGRRHAGRVLQLVTGAIGLADWEWGITIFGRDPLDIKRLVTEMRYDTASAEYAEFGSFHLGRLAEGDAWIEAAGQIIA